MKHTALFAATAVTALSLAGQVFAMGGLSVKSGSMIPHSIASAIMTKANMKTPTSMPLTITRSTTNSTNVNGTNGTSMMNGTNGTSMMNGTAN